MKLRGGEEYQLIYAHKKGGKGDIKENKGKTGGRTRHNSNKKRRNWGLSFWDGRGWMENASDGAGLLWCERRSEE